MVLPFFPVIALIYSLDRFSGIDDHLRFLLAIVLISGSLLLFFLGFYFEISRGNLNNKKVKFAIGGFRFGIAEVARVVLSVGLLLFSYLILNYAMMGMRFVNAIENIATIPQKQMQRGYSLVSMVDFDIGSQKTYGRVGMLAGVDDELKLGFDEFLADQNFILNPIPTMFDTPFEMINAMYNDEVASIIIGSNFVHVFDELSGFENIATDTLVLKQFDLEVRNVERAEVDPKKPFSILLLGLNQFDQALTSGAINVFMLLTVNLEELSFTITSIPRDSYVPIPCNNYIYDKLSHTNLGGSTCAVGAIEQMFDMKIPYYVKLNFAGFMEIVDVLGGIEVDVPLAFQEQDSRRRFSEDHLIRLEAGMQRLNAEQALALARHRGKTGNSGMTGDDFTRVEHQQLVFKAMLDEMLQQANSINDLIPLVEVIGDHVETNLSAHEIMSIGQYLTVLLATKTSTDLMNEIHFSNMVILGDTTTIDVRHYGHLWVSFPWKERITEARRLMMINLGYEEPVPNFGFEYDGFIRRESLGVYRRNEQGVSNNES